MVDQKLKEAKRMLHDYFMLVNLGCFETVTVKYPDANEITDNLDILERARVNTLI